MTDHIEERTTVTRALVPDDKRLSHIEALFGTHFPLLIEPVIYGITERMAEGYQGGLWQFWRLDNGGFYMAPDSDQIYQVSCDNYFTGQLSTDALGITACLYTYSHCSFSQDKMFGKLMSDHYHWLRAYMFEHPEVAGILGAID